MFRDNGDGCIKLEKGGDVSEVVDAADLSKPIARRKALSARTDAGLATTVDFGESGTCTFDEPSAHGGTDIGPTPLQAVPAALCACEPVTFSQTAKGMEFANSGIDFGAAFTINNRDGSGVQGVVPHFQSVKAEARVTTNEPENRLRAVGEEIEQDVPFSIWSRMRKFASIWFGFALPQDENGWRIAFRSQIG